MNLFYFLSFQEEWVLYSMAKKYKRNSTVAMVKTLNKVIITVLIGGLIGYFVNWINT